MKKQRQIELGRGGKLQNVLQMTFFSGDWSAGLDLILPPDHHGHDQGQKPPGGIALGLE